MELPGTQHHTAALAKGRAGAVTPTHPSSRAWPGWALPSGLTGLPWANTGVSSSITAAGPHARGNPARLPGPWPARQVSFHSPLGFLSSSESEKVTSRGEERQDS